MSPSPDQRRRLAADGFTLIEVIVAMAIFMVVATASAPVILGGLRGAATARDVSQTKGIAQGQLEKMREMPFYVGAAAGDYKDVLDTYYRCGPTSISTTNPAPTPTSPDCTNNVPSATPSCSSTTMTSLPPATGWNGYVAAGATHCAWEPTGPLYRVVVNPVVAPGLGAFAMTISTQFLTGGATPVVKAPSATYTSRAAGADAPPTSQVGVTVAVFYKTASGVRYSVSYSQIEQGNPVTPSITTQATSSAVRVASALDVNTNLLEQLGVVNLTGELYTGSRVVTTASAATAGDSLGQQINGARVNFVAPVDQTSTGATSGNVAYPTSGCAYQCFGDTAVDQASALASNGLPRAGSATAPVRAMIPSATNSDGFRFSNGTGDARLLLDGSQPMVSLDTDSSSPSTVLPVSNCAVQTTGSTAAYLVGTGYLDANAGGVAACGTAQSNAVRLFPTTFAPKGVIRIVLKSSIASCSVVRPGGGSATATAQATVSYWNGSGYTTVPTLASTNPTDPLANVPLTTVVDTASGLTLGDYVKAWKSATQADVKTSVTSTTAQASLASAVSITTKPTRAADQTSVVSMDLGAVSCQASDLR